MTISNHNLVKQLTFQELQNQRRTEQRKCVCINRLLFSLQTHSFAHDERQQVIEERGEDVCRHSGGQQWNSLPGKLQEHGIILRLNQKAHGQKARLVSAFDFFTLHLVCSRLCAKQLTSISTYYSDLYVHNTTK